MKYLITSLRNTASFVGCMLLLMLSACYAPTSVSTLPTPSASPTPAGAPIQPAPQQAQAHVPHQLIIGYTNPAQLRDFEARYGLSVIQNWPSIQTALVKLPARLTITKAQAFFSRHARYTIPNHLYSRPYTETGGNARALTRQSTVSDPDVAYQWQHRQLNTAAAWDKGIMGKGIRIGIHDSFVDHRHPDLINNFNPSLPGFDGASNTLIQADTPHNGVSNHGSAVAGSALASANAIGGRGVAPEATLVPLNISDPTTNNLRGDAIISAAIFAVQGPDGIAGGETGDTDSAPGINAYVHVVNMSWGGIGWDQATSDVMNYMLEHGIVLVTAAGNTPTDGPSDPSWISGLINVAATTPTGDRTTFSNRGDHIDVAAPGQFVWVATTRDCIYNTPDGSSCQADDTKHTFISGTSFASPFTAGAAALILEASAVRDANGAIVRDALNTPTVQLSANTVHRILEQTANQPFRGTFTDALGHGIVDVGAAVDQALNQANWPPQGSNLYAKVVDNQDLPVGGVSLTLTSLDSAAQPTKYTQTTTGGSLAGGLADGGRLIEGSGYFLQVAPGSYQLTAGGVYDSENYNPDNYGLASRVLTLMPGDNEITIKLDIKQFEDTNEPNNTTATATPVQVGQSLEGSFDLPVGTAGTDTDVFTFNATQDTTYIINLEKAKGGYDAVLRLLDADGSTVLADNDDYQPDVSTDPLIRYTATADGPLYVELSNANDLDSPAQVYYLDITVLAGSETEPNGTAVGTSSSIIDFDSTGANTLSVGQALEAALSSGLDADAYALELSAGTTVTVAVEGANQFNPDSMLGLFDAAGALVAFNDDSCDSYGCDSYVRYSVTESGTYHAVVVSWNSEPAAGDGGYIISASSAPTP